MKFNLSFTTGKDKQPAPTRDKAFDTILGGLIDVGASRLSSETTVSTKLLQANKGWVYRNNDVIAQEVSKLEFELYTVGISQGEIVFNEVTSHPLLDLLDQPNDESTKSDFIYTTQSHRKLTGDAFWLKIRNGIQVIKLRQIPADKITLQLQTPTVTDPTVIKAYQYKDIINGEKIEIIYDPKDIIHFKRPNPSNSFRGLGVVEAMAETIDLDNLTEETAKQFFKNGALTNFVLTTDKSLTDDQLKRLKAEMKSTYSGATNAYKTMILSGGLTPKDISYSNKDMQFLDQLEWYRDKIMVGFGNTKASLGIIDDVNRASHESSINAWLANTVKPEMAALVNTLNEFLLPEFGTNLLLGFCNPVPEDKTDDITEATELYTAGIVTLNEARDLLEYDETDNGGDEFKAPAPAPMLPKDPGSQDEAKN